MHSDKLISLIVVLLVTLIAGAYPFIRKLQTARSFNFPIGEALAAGVFLGAGLIHMLSDAADNFQHLHIDYPLAFLIAGSTFLFFLLLEHIGQEIHHHHGFNNQFAILATIMLSIHSLFAGAALGLSTTTSMTFIILLAILAHKWAASFALAIQINKSSLSMKAGITLFLIFAAMVPLGIYLGSETQLHADNYPTLQPIFQSIAAGTFLYLGTLHGLERAVLIKQCCNLKGFLYMILGFAIMAVVAIWT